MGIDMDCSTFVFGADYRFQSVDTAAERHSGYTLRQLLSMHPWDLKPHFTRATFSATVDPLLAGELDGLVIDTVHRRANGALVPVSVNLRRLADQGGGLALAIVREQQPAREIAARAMREAVRWQSLQMQDVPRRDALCRLAANMTETAALVPDDPDLAVRRMEWLAGYFTSLSWLA